MPVLEQLLLLLTEKYPPPEGRNHAITLRQDGKPGLALVLAIGEQFHTFHLDHEDFNSSAEDILEGVEELMILRGPPGTN